MTTLLTDDPTQFPAQIPAPTTGDLFSVVRTVFGQALANRTGFLKALCTQLGVPKIRFGTAAAMVALTGNLDGDVFLVTSYSSPLGFGLYTFDSTLSQSATELASPPWLINATSGGGAWKHAALGLLGVNNGLPYLGADGRVAAAQLEICTTNVDSANRIPSTQVKNGLIYVNGDPASAGSTSTTVVMTTFTIPNLLATDIIIVDWAGTVNRTGSTGTNIDLRVDIAGAVVGDAEWSANTGGNPDTSTVRAMSVTGYGVAGSAGSVVVNANLNSSVGLTVSATGVFRCLVFRP